MERYFRKSLKKLNIIYIHIVRRKEAERECVFGTCTEEGNCICEKCFSGISCDAYGMLAIMFTIDCFPKWGGGVNHPKGIENVNLMIR